MVVMWSAANGIRCNGADIRLVRQRRELVAVEQVTDTTAPAVASGALMVATPINATPMVPALPRMSQTSWQ